MSSEQKLNAMDIKAVSKSYYTALYMVHDLTTDLYESIHDDKGNPILDEEFLYQLIQQYKKVVRGELDMIKSAAAQYNESR